jgi:hypothetical protein
MAFTTIAAGIAGSYKMFAVPPNLSRKQSKVTKSLGRTYPLNPHKYTKLKNGQIIRIDHDDNKVMRLGKAAIKAAKRLTHVKGYYLRERTLTN